MTEVSKRTSSKAAERHEGRYDVTQEVKVDQQGSTVGMRLVEYGTALSVGGAQLVIAHIADVHQEVEDIPQCASWGLKVKQSSLHLR